MVSFFGGRAAEALVLDDISTGASNDIERATSLARSMVVKYGMSGKLGPIAYEEGDGNVFLGRDLAKARTYSEATAQRIDEEIAAILTAAYDKAMHILTLNREMLDALAERLLETETIRQAEFEALFEQYGHEFTEEEGND